MAQAKKGDRVSVHYKGMLSDGNTFDSSFDREPLMLIVGEGLALPMFEEAIEGMNVGETKTVKIPSDDAYGPHIGDLIMEYDRSAFPSDMEVEAGAHIQFELEDGGVAVAKIVNVTDTKVSIDANHPLAGQDLTFDIKLVDIV